MFRVEVRLVLAVLAVYRLALMLASEDGPLHLIQKGRRTIGRLAAPRTGNTLNDEARLSLAELVNCPYCLGVWLAAGALLLVTRPTRAGDVGLAWLGIAGGQAWLQGRRPWQP